MNNLNFFQRREFGDNVSFTFQFVKENFLHYFVNVLLLNIPIWVLVGGGLYLFADNFVSMFVALQGGGIGAIILPLLILFLFVLIWFAYSSSITYNYYVLHMEKGAKNFSLQDLFSASLASMIRLLVANLILGGIIFVILIVVGILIGALGKLGTILAIPLPIVLLMYAVRLAFFQIVVIREKKSAMEAITKSFFLVKDHWWETFGLIVVFGIIGYLISSIIDYIFGTFGANTFNYESILRGSFTPTMGGVIVYVVVSIITSSLTNMFSATAIFAQYGNLVEQKEGVGLKGKIDKLGKTTDNETDEEDF
jgi:hypothetical protein